MRNQNAFTNTLFAQVFCANLCKKVGKNKGNPTKKKKKNEKITTRFYFHIFIARFLDFI